MSDSFDTTVAWYEQIIEASTDATLDQIHATLEQFGAVPFGYTRGTREQRWEQYLALRDDIEAWRALVGQNAQSVGWDFALARAIAESTQLEKQIARAGGVEAVRSLLAERLVRDAKPALREAERIRQKPKVQILPPLPPGDEVEVIQRWIDTATAGLQPVTDAFVPSMPPPPRTFPPAPGVPAERDIAIAG